MYRQKHTASQPAKTEQPPVNYLTEAFKHPHFDFLQTIPKNKQDKLGKSFQEARSIKKDFGRAEQALLAILNDFPENPFVTMRLLAFYTANNRTLAAKEMANKTQIYAQSQKIPLERLL